MPESRRLIASVFPDRAVESTSVSTAGNSKQTVAVWFEQEDPVVLQYSTDASLRTEGELARAIRARTTVPVPRVVEIGSDGASSYLVTELAPGKNLHTRFADLDRDAQLRIARQFGQYLAEIHEAFSFEGVGQVDSSLGPDDLQFRAGESGDFEDWFCQYAMEGIEALPKSFDPVRGRLKEAVLSGAYDRDWDPRLFPWDLRPGNALAMDGELSAVLDWGGPLAAPPGLAVAKAQHLLADWYVEDAEPLRAAFHDGYESIRPYPDVPAVFPLVAIIRSAVDSHGVVTRPRYPEWTGDKAVSFHLDRLRDVVTETDGD